ncbi:glycerophosphodiester phosphodiesterase family protein [Kribbella sp. VKM Ac-2568]|uniref:glycerophosphodiester phosphodiesterase n=1 Tax=Kribbella sp. VKM Ac-2568 TaxID=2512219 RepID=UPI001049B3B4|nr:glycerophosphodiester phosphodiesterase family protein [Kribbella sp. VKM Ac-2568]TCM49481.1 glycerophosphoryl diester phosphodiesterase [Kribbella sp. VKM Ac-2568]
MGKRPSVVAHRGASEVSPEHTLAAYRRAVEAGADGLECDIRLTADGHLVCVHDRRIDRTSNGRGVLSTMRLEELDSFDWGSWKTPWADLDDEAELPDPDLLKVLTLERLLETVRDAGRPLELAIETKHPTRYAGLVERRLIEMLDRFGWAHPKVGSESPVRVMSFSWLSLRRMRVMAPGLRTVLLMDRVPLRFRDGSLPTGVSYAGPSLEIVTAHPEFVDRAHKHGHQVHVWTVNTEQDVLHCADVGVDAIISDRPELALKTLAAPRPATSLPTPPSKPSRSPLRRPRRPA